jgi:hypothetical protein
MLNNFFQFQVKFNINISFCKLKCNIAYIKSLIIPKIKFEQLFKININKLEF